MTRKLYQKTKRPPSLKASGLVFVINKIQKLTLLDDFLAERAVVLEEALAGLDAEPAGANHLAHQRMRAVLRVAGLVIQSFHDSEVYVVANQVSGVQRTGLHTGRRAA